jgi:hypothetical protein
MRICSPGWLVALLFIVAMPSVCLADGMPFRHGVGLFHPYTSADLDQGQPKKYTAAPFSSPKHTLTPAQISAIRAAGFDFVRLPVDPGPFLDFQGAQRDALDTQLLATVQLLVNAGLGVIVDFHPNPIAPDAYSPKALVTSTNAPVFQAYCDMLTRSARMLEGVHSDRVALELMNEPAQGWSAVGYATWQDMLQRLYQAARNGSQRLKLVLPGGNGGNYPGLTHLDPTPFQRDNAVLYTFHYYEPHEFTTQSYSPDPKYRVLADIPYPTEARPLSESVVAMNARLTKIDASPTDRVADESRGMAELERYRAADFSHAVMDSEFDEIAAWAKSHQIAPSRIFMGEFGVIRKFGPYDGAREPERLRWLHDVRIEAERRGFIWSIWVFSGSGGMAITNDAAYTVVDTRTLRAIGLK